MKKSTGRRYQTLDVLSMYSTLTEAQWRHCLESALRNGNMEKLIAWRYGMQAGLSDLVKSGLSSEKIELWVMKRIYNLEKCARLILKRKHHIKISGDYKDKTKSAVSALMAKRQRDREFEMFLRRSAF